MLAAAPNAAINIRNSMLTFAMTTYALWTQQLAGCKYHSPVVLFQVQSILKPTQGVTWRSGKPENEGGHGAIFLE